MTQHFQVRAGQREFERGIEQHRISAFLTRRQYGKTTEAARIALKKMMMTAGHDVVFGSVKLDLGRDMIRKESAALQKAFQILATQVQAARGKLDAVVAGSDKSIAAISADDWADLYESSRLEMRLYHSQTVYSRTKIVALTPDAVGETGDLILDEVGRVRNFRAVWEAVKPIISSNPTFRCILTTTPPPDDSHYSFELLAPPTGFNPPPAPGGHWYKSELGVWCLRVTAWDAYADGVMLYDDDTGAPITPDESRALDRDKDAWDRNYGVKFVLGGTSACSLLALQTAMERGVGQCACFVIDSDSDFDRAIAWIREHVGGGPVGLGLDLATTEKATSNPSAFAIVEQVGVDLIARALIVWKTKDPDIAMDRIARLVDAVEKRPAGGRAKALSVDATNERYFASDIRKALAKRLPVHLIVNSETVERPGYEPMNYKQFLGGQLVGELDDNHLWLPPERYIKDDFRLVKKERGLFVCEPDTDGKHGDTFDATKLAIHSLKGAPPPMLPKPFANSRIARLRAARRERVVLA